MTLVAAMRRGAAPLAANVAGALQLARLPGLWRIWTGNAGQFIFLGMGYYAVFSWASAQKRRDRAAFALTWGSPAFLCIVLAYGAVCFMGYSVSYWAAPYAERVYGVDKAQLGWMLGAPAALGGFLGVILGGRVADALQARFAAGRVMVIGFGLLAPVPIDPRRL